MTGAFQWPHPGDGEQRWHQVQINSGFHLCQVTAFAKGGGELCSDEG